jgi:hypothetical protein
VRVSGNWRVTLDQQAQFDLWHAEQSRKRLKVKRLAA